MKCASKTESLITGGLINRHVRERGMMSVWGMIHPTKHSYHPTKSDDFFVFLLFVFLLISFFLASDRRRRAPVASLTSFVIPLSRMIIPLLTNMPGHLGWRRAEFWGENFS